MKRAIVPTLFLTGVACSTFMVLETQAYYQGLYNGRWASLLPWLAAAVQEVPMHWMALARVEDRRWMNLWFRFLMLCLFAITVASSWMNVAGSGLAQVTERNRAKDLKQALERGLADDRAERSRFDEQNQRSNFALSARSRQENQQELVELLKKPVTHAHKEQELLGLLIVRILVQAVGLTCMWLAGHLYRASLVSAQNAGGEPADQVGSLKPVIQPGPSDPSPPSSVAEATAVSPDGAEATDGGVNKSMEQVDPKSTSHLKLVDPGRPEVDLQKIKELEAKNSELSRQVVDLKSTNESLAKQADLLPEKEQQIQKLSQQVKKLKEQPAGKRYMSKQEILDRMSKLNLTWEQVGQDLERDKKYITNSIKHYTDFIQYLEEMGAA